MPAGVVPAPSLFVELGHHTASGGEIDPKGARDNASIYDVCYSQMPTHVKAAHGDSDRNSNAIMIPPDDGLFRTNGNAVGQHV